MPTSFFGTVWPKICDRKTRYPLLYINFSDTSIFLKHGRDAHKSFWYCETIFFRRKMWYVPFFQPKNLSETRSFPKNSRIPLQKFSAMWDKHFSAENCGTQTMHKNVWYPKVSGTIKECPRKFCALWDRNFFGRNYVVAPILHKLFRLP